MDDIMVESDAGLTHPHPDNVPYAEEEKEESNDVYNITRQTENYPPSVGMEFPNIEAAYNFYNAYEKMRGFGVRRQSTNASKKPGGEIISKTFVCDKEGKKYLKDKRQTSNEIARRRETRVGCKAKLRLKLTESKTWSVSVFIAEYNGHDPTSPDKVRRHRSHKKLHRTEGCVKLVRSLDNEGFAPSTISKVINVVSGDKEETLTPQQCHQIVRTQKKNSFGQECMLIVQKFRERSKLDPDF